MRTSLLLVMVAAVGCGGGDPGTAPTISALVFSPQTAPVGMATVVSGTMTFADSDGDVDLLGLAVTPPGGAPQAPDPVPIQTTGDPTQGTVTWAFSIAPPSAGAYAFELWLIDEGGNASNRLPGTITAP